MNTLSSNVELFQRLMVLLESKIVSPFEITESPDPICIEPYLSKNGIKGKNQAQWKQEKNRFKRC